MDTEVRRVASETVAASDLLRYDIHQNFLTRLELAAVLKKTDRTLTRWDALRIGPPAIRIGRSVYYKRSSVLEWIASNERKPRRRG